MLCSRLYCQKFLRFKLSSYQIRIEVVQMAGAKPREISAMTLSRSHSLTRSLALALRLDSMWGHIESIWIQRCPKTFYGHFELELCETEWNDAVCIELKIVPSCLIPGQDLREPRSQIQFKAEAVRFCSRFAQIWIVQKSMIDLPITYFAN